MQLSNDINFFQRKRYIVIFLTFCGMLLYFMVKTNLSIAMVNMIKISQLAILRFSKLSFRNILRIFVIYLIFIIKILFL